MSRMMIAAPFSLCEVTTRRMGDKGDDILLRFAPGGPGIYIVVDERCVIGIDQQDTVFFGTYLYQRSLESKIRETLD